MNEEIQIQGQQSQQKEQKGKRAAFLLLLAILLVGISIGFAVLSTSLNISGTSTIQNNSWNVSPDPTNGIECPSGQVCTINPSNPGGLTPDDGEPTPENPNPKGAIIWMDGNTVYFKHLLKAPGDVFTFNVTFKNSGTIDAKVANVTTNQLNATAQNFLTYSVTYANGSAVAAGDSLNAGASATFKVTVAYKSSVTTLPTTEELALINETANGHTGATSLFTVSYEQK